MKRKIDKEQFFTRRDLAKKCIDFVVGKCGDLKNFPFVLEPSAGSGAFSSQINHKKLIALDIEPQCESVQSGDFLSFDLAGSGGLTIGNPPFGARCSLALKFINRAARFSDVIAFILPRSFNKYTFQNSVDENFHLVDSFDCDEFESPGGQPISVKCVFQIWRRHPEKRAKQIEDKMHPDFSLEHCHFSQVPAEEFEEIKNRNDFAIPQVGNYKVILAKDVKSGSYWFVKSNVGEGLREEFSHLDFSFLNNCNTTFQSRAKTDIIKAYKNLKNES